MDGYAFRALGGGVRWVVCGIEELVWGVYAWKVVAWEGEVGHERVRSADSESNNEVVTLGG